MDNLESQLSKLDIEDNERTALIELVNRLRGIWPGIELRLYGSKVKGTADEESDIDLLVLMPETVTAEMRKRIIHEVFKINLAYDSNISPLIMSKSEWNTGTITALPIHSYIEEEGIALK